jgi:hypothetical protein
MIEEIQNEVVTYLPPLSPAPYLLDPSRLLITRQQLSMHISLSLGFRVMGFQNPETVISVDR